MDTYWVTVIGRDYGATEDTELIYILKGNNLAELVADVRAIPRVASFDIIKSVETDKV